MHPTCRPSRVATALSPRSPAPQAADLQAQLTAAARERERLQHRAGELEGQLVQARASAQRDLASIQNLSSELDKVCAAQRSTAQHGAPRMNHSTRAVPEDVNRPPW